MTLRGEDAHNAKLTDDAVREIIKARQNGISRKALAEKFGVSCTAIKRVERRRSWKHVVIENDDIK